ncbi:MAG: hypothetical protein WBH44_03830 [Proteocatella sp.]
MKKFDMKYKISIAAILFLFIFYFLSPTNYKAIVSAPVFEPNTKLSEKLNYLEGDTAIYYYDGKLSYDQEIEGSYRTILRDINDPKIKFHFIENSDEAKIVTTYRGFLLRFYEFNNENEHLFDKNIYSIEIYCQSDKLKFINLN